MPRKKGDSIKDGKYNDVLLPPSVFERGAAKLGICVDHAKQVTSHAPLVAATTATRIVTLCDNEAMEYLRQCQGQFVALLSSELASCDLHLHSKKKKRKKSEKNGTNTCDENEAGRGEGVHDDAIRTIMPRHVLSALERLDFHEIKKDLEHATAQHHPLGKNNIQQHGIGNSKRAATVRNKRNQKRKLLLDKSSMADLMKEQERLFANSASKAIEEASRNKRV